MKILWKSNAGATVGDVQQRLEDPPLAYTTVATMLRKMEDRGLVRHCVRQRKFHYQAAVDERDVSRSMSAHLVERLFEGSLAEAVNHLLETRHVDRRELDRLEQLIRERRKKL